MKKNEKGFSIVEILIAFVLVGLIGTVGWLVYDRQKDIKPKDSSATNTSTEQNSTDKKANTEIPQEKTYTPEIPSGWVKMTDTTTSTQYAVPAGWADELKVAKFNVDENIHVGFGAPVWVRFASNVQAWQTIDIDVSGTPTVVRAENIVSTSNIKAEDKYTVGTYSTGDGGGAQYRVLVVKDKQVLQFSLPSTCNGVICEGDKKWTVDEIKGSISQFIKTITLG